MNDTPLARRATAMVTAALFVAGLIAAVVVRGDEDVVDASGEERAAATTTTALPADAAGGAGGGEAPATTAGGAAPQGTTATTARSTATSGRSSAPTTQPSAPIAQPPSAPAPAASAPDTAPPKAGRYRYRVTDQNGEESDSAATIEDRGEADGVRMIRITPEPSEGEETVAQVIDTRWSSSAVHFDAMDTPFGRCDWQPDLLMLKLPLAAGSTWESASKCTLTVNGAPVPLDGKVTARVGELRQVKAAGADVTVWTIDTTLQVSGGGQTFDIVSTEWFSPKHGMAVWSKTTADGNTFEEELLNLTPE